MAPGKGPSTTQHLLGLTFLRERDKAYTSFAAPTSCMRSKSRLLRPLSGICSTSVTRRWQQYLICIHGAAMGTGSCWRSFSVPRLDYFLPVFPLACLPLAPFDVGSNAARSSSRASFRASACAAQGTAHQPVECASSGARDAVALIKHERQSTICKVPVFSIFCSGSEKV